MADVIEQAIRFPAAGRDALTLEGVVTRPSGDGSAPLFILCHPQPASSSMDDPLLRQVAAELAASGMVALRFNFRGVGESEGQQTDGRLEPLDIAGAVACGLLQPGIDPDRVGLAGHAFGACVALAYAAHDPRIKTVVAVSPPTFRLTPDLGEFTGPRLFVTGEHDEVCPRHKLEPWIERLDGPRGLRIVTGARHLMRGHEAIASGVITQYATRWAHSTMV